MQFVWMITSGQRTEYKKVTEPQPDNIEDNFYRAMLAQSAVMRQ